MYIGVFIPKNHSHYVGEYDENVLVLVKFLYLKSLKNK